MKETDSLQKKYYRIADVSEMLGIPAPTLRFWEGEFKELKPHRNDRGTRYYTPADIELLRNIQFLVHGKGLKIAAARKQLRINREGVDKTTQVIQRLEEIRDNLSRVAEALHELR